MPNPDYKWFVIFITRGKPENVLIIASGWEYKDDAQDDLRENEQFYSETADTYNATFPDNRSPVVGPRSPEARPKVVSRRYLKQHGIDPDDDIWWMHG